MTTNTWLQLWLNCCHWPVCLNWFCLKIVYPCVPLRLKLSLFSPWNGNFGDISTTSDCTIPVFLVGYPTWIHIGYRWLLLYLTHRNVEDRDPHVFLSFALPDFPFMDYDDLLTGSTTLKTTNNEIWTCPIQLRPKPAQGDITCVAYRRDKSSMRSPYGSTKSSTHLEIAHQMTLLSCNVSTTIVTHQPISTQFYHFFMGSDFNHQSITGWFNIALLTSLPSFFFWVMPCQHWTNALPCHAQSAFGIDRNGLYRLRHCSARVRLPGDGLGIRQVGSVAFEEWLPSGYVKITIENGDL
jgi:hypothetical protein